MWCIQCSILCHALEVNPTEEDSQHHTIVVEHPTSHSGVHRLRLREGERGRERERSGVALIVLIASKTSRHMESLKMHIVAKTPFRQSSSRLVHY